MPVKKHFVNRALQEMMIDEYLAKSLDNAGYAGLEMQKTPMGSRITIKTARPGIVIGQKGRQVKTLTEEIKAKFNINVPTIDVEMVKEPELNAQIMAERLAFAIEKGQNYRRAAYSIIRRIIGRGARGVEISISGKVTSQRARRQTFRAGRISKCGTPAIEGVQHGIAHVILKTGVMGIQVHIMPESYKMPDEVTYRDEAGVKDYKAQKKKVALVDDYTSPDDEDEVEIEEETEEENLFDDTSKATATLLKTDEKEEAEVPKEVVEKKTKASKKAKAEKEEEKAEEGEEKKAPKKKSSRKKSSKKAADEDEEAKPEEKTADAADEDE
jgi:small subunit ribosomal protein S3